MLKQLLVVWIAIAIAIAITGALVPSVEIDGGVVALLGVALVYGLVNALIGPLLRLVSLPLTMVTLGLFALVINAALLAITAGLSSHLDVGGFFGVIVGALLISIFTSVLVFVAGKTFLNLDEGQ